MMFRSAAILLLLVLPAVRATQSPGKQPLPAREKQLQTSTAAKSDEKAQQLQRFEQGLQNSAKLAGEVRQRAAQEQKQALEARTLNDAPSEAVRPRPTPQQQKDASLVSTKTLRAPAAAPAGAPGGPAAPADPGTEAKDTMQKKLDDHHDAEYVLHVNDQAPAAAGAPAASWPSPKIDSLHETVQHVDKETGLKDWRLEYGANGHQGKHSPYHSRRFVGYGQQDIYSAASPRQVFGAAVVAALLGATNLMV